MLALKTGNIRLENKVVDDDDDGADDDDGEDNVQG